MPTTLGPLARSYLNARRAEGLDRATLRNIDITLTSFADSFGHRPVSHLGSPAVVRWLTANEAWASTTRGTKVCMLRCFARWCETAGHTPMWSATIPKIRREVTVPRYVEGEAFEATLGATTSTRERAILWLLFGCGLRCVEVARLTVADWNRRDGYLVATGKGRNERTVPVPPPVAAALGAYLAEHPVAGGPIIRRADGCPRGIAPNTVSSLTRRMLRRAGVKSAPFDGVCAHGMRAAAATGVLESSGDIRVAQELLGHRHASSTSAYLRRAGLESVRSAMLNRADLPA